jgi:ribonuclease III
MAANNRNSGVKSELKQAHPPGLESGGEELSGIEKLLAHRFLRPDLLTQALTHRSLAYEQKKDSDSALNPPNDNEQLEFLGDAVIGFLAADDLCRRYPELNEGQLTRLRAELVSRKHLGEVASRLDLGAYMFLGRGEERSGGRKNSALLANCIEAVVAALYLDAGIDHTRGFVAREVIEPSVVTLRDRMIGGSSIGDHKSALQELIQAQKLGAPEYLVKAESGPDHRKRFLVEVFVSDKDTKPKALARGVGNTKKKAEQEAARQALARLQRRKRVEPKTDPTA